MEIFRQIHAITVGLSNNYNTQPCMGTYMPSREHNVLLIYRGLKQRTFMSRIRNYITKSYEMLIFTIALNPTVV